MSSRLPGVLRVLRVLRAEGGRAVVERAWDRLGEARRRGSFGALGGLDRVPAGFSTPLLNLAAAPPAPRLGGVQGQLLRRLEAERKLRPVALLYPEGWERREAVETEAGGQEDGENGREAAGYRLELDSGSERLAVRWPAGGPDARDEPGSTALAAAVVAAAGDESWSAALASAVAAAARAVGARAVQVEGLAGLPLGALARLREEGFELVFALHDFATFCPRPHLLERSEPPRFCHFSQEPARCLACLRHDWPWLDESFQPRRRRLAGELLRAAAAVVYPSDYLRRAHRELFAGLDPARQRVIAPPAATGGKWPVTSQATSAASSVAISQATSPATSPSAPAWQPGAARPGPHRARQPLRHAALVGRVDAGKGAEVFARAVELLGASAPALRFSVFGGAGDHGLLRRLRRLPGVRVRGYYREGSLADRLREARVDLALLLSIVPESYGLALDECAAAGVPAAAFDQGALGERLAAAGGLLLPAPRGLAEDAEAVAGLLARLASGEETLPTPPATPLGSSPREAAQAWARLYSELGLLAGARR